MQNFLSSLKIRACIHFMRGERGSVNMAKKPKGKKSKGGKKALS